MHVVTDTDCPSTRAHAPDARAAEFRQIAASLGLAYREHGLTPVAHVSYQQALAAGIVALDEALCGFRLAISPDAAGRSILFRHQLFGRTDIAVMPPASFRAMLDAHCRVAIIDHAAHHLPNSRPGQSARQGLTRGQGSLTAAALALTLALLWLSPEIALFALAIITMPLFYGLVLIRLGATIDSQGLPAPTVMRLPDVQLPIYTVLVPLFREAAVVPQLVQSLLALDYPHPRLDIMILVEEDDPLTATTLAALALPRHMRVVHVPAGEPQTKPRALNVGLLQARGDLVAVFDAEDRPDPRQLRLAANLFHRLPAHVGCLQGRLVIDNVDDSFLSRMFALEYAGLFDVVNTGLIRVGLPILLGGTSNHFRTHVMRRVGGWDAWNVTEDADLSFRLVRNGYIIRDLPSDTLEEAPAHAGLWFRQRVRWMKGFVQTIVTHTRTPQLMMRETGLAKGFALLSLCAGTLLSALGYPVFVLATAASLIIYGMPTPSSAGAMLLITLWLTLFMAGMLAMIAPLVLGARHRGLQDLWPWLLLAPVYYLLVSAAAWMAIVEYVRAPSRWNKTEHGLARTSRSASRKIRT